VRPLSIRTRLTVWFATVSALVLLAIAATTWWTLRSIVINTVDEGLAVRVQAIAGFLDRQSSDLSFAEMHEDLREYAALDPGWDLIRISDLQGQQIFLSAAFTRGGLPEVPSGHLAPGGLHENIVVDGRPLRMLSKYATLRQQVCIVQVAVPTRELELTSVRFRAALMVLVPLGILAAAAGGYWISRRALAPVDRLTSTARAITAAEFGRRLEVPHTGDELQRLSETLNSMLLRLETAFRETSRFTADASHELRTPISVIRTAAEIALRRDRTTDEYRKALGGILGEAERTSALLQDLLTLARADAGVAGLQRSEIDLCQVLEDVRGSIGSVCDREGLEFRIDQPGGPVSISGDRAALGRLVVILADNAVKYTAPPGRVDLALNASDGAARIVVSDSGIGIGPEDLPHVFDRFYRADRARSRDSGGVGLGLSIAKWIVEQHRGSIEIESAPGKGCRVEVRLPLG
jgi:heavy metal sensor kinase